MNKPKDNNTEVERLKQLLKEALAELQAIQKEGYYVGKSLLEKLQKHTQETK